MKPPLEDEYGHRVTVGERPAARLEVKVSGPHGHEMKVVLDHGQVHRLHTRLAGWLVDHQPKGGPWKWDPKAKGYVDRQTGLPSGRVSP